MPEKREFGGYGCILIATSLSDEQIKRGFAILFGIDSNRVLVDRDNIWFEQTLTDVDVVCTIFDKVGDFPTHVELTVLNTALSLTKELPSIAKLSRTLGLPAVVEDVVANNDYIWVLVEPEGSIKRIWVDRDTFNEHESIKIVGDVASVDQGSE